MVTDNTSIFKYWIFVEFAYLGKWLDNLLLYLFWFTKNTILKIEILRIWFCWCQNNVPKLSWQVTETRITSNSASSASAFLFLSIFLQLSFSTSYVTIYYILCSTFFHLLISLFAYFRTHFFHLSSFYSFNLDKVIRSRLKTENHFPSASFFVYQLPHLLNFHTPKFPRESTNIPSSFLFYHLLHVSSIQTPILSSLCECY